MTLALCYRVIEKRNFRGSLEMSFFISCPIHNAVAGPDKSGHRPPWCMIVKPALHVCPDLRGWLRPPVKGHEIKKDISILFAIFSFSGASDSNAILQSYSRKKLYLEHGDVFFVLRPLNKVL